MHHEHFTAIEVDRLRVDMHLGCTEEEQATKQPVEISLRLYPQTPPHGCESDQITDTVCYDELCQALYQFCESNTLHLIEHLTTELFRIARSLIADDTTRLWIKVVKCNAPVKGLKGHTAFVYSDLPPEMAAGVTG